MAAWFLGRSFQETTVAMNVRTFFSPNTRDALRQVRDALGADALILSNRRVEGGVEIMAVADREMQALTYSNLAPASRLAGRAPVAPESLAAILPRRQSAAVAAQATPAPTIRRPRFETLQSPPSAVTGAAAYRDQAGFSASNAADGLPSLASGAPVEQPILSPPAASASQPMLEPASASEVAPQVSAMAAELKRMRSLLESQLSGFAWGELARKDPLKADLMRTLLTAGFSPLLARRLLNGLPPGLDHEKGLKWLKAALAHNLRVVAPGADFITRGGVYALVGPTGVGKTTTVAKLAARAILKFGADRVALLTTDSYRIGAHEQLKIYGRILNVPVHAVKDEAELELTLADLTRSHLILVDTVGMSQRDRRIADQIEFLCGRGSRIKRHLLLPATAQSVTLDDIVHAYRGAGMDGVILSKVDESLAVAPAVDCLIRHGLSVHYVTNGQRVPEDLHLADARYMVDRAFRQGPPSQAHVLRHEEWEIAASVLEETQTGGALG